MFSPQSYTNVTDINLHLVCDNKELQKAAHVLFYPFAVWRCSLSFFGLSDFALMACWTGRYVHFPLHLPSFLVAEFVRQQGGSNKEATRTEIWGHLRRHRGLQLRFVFYCQNNEHKHA